MCKIVCIHIRAQNYSHGVYADDAASQWSAINISIGEARAHPEEKLRG